MLQYKNLLNYLSYPLRAVSSRRFYYLVLFGFKGAGFSYLLMLSVLIAIPATIKVKSALEYLKQFELPSVVAKIPASYIDSSGQLHPQNQADNRQILIANSKGQYIIAYNLENEPLKDLPNGAIMPITITSNSLMIHTDGGIVNLPWSSFYGNQGGAFEPLEAAKVLDTTFSSSYLSVWVVVAMWLMSIMAFAILVAAVITKVMASILMKMAIGFVDCLRLCAFGATAVALLLLAQFFFNLSLSYIILCLVPTFYSLSFLNNVRQMMALATEDPKAAFAKTNPLWIWFDIISRFKYSPDFQTRMVEYDKLSFEEKHMREVNLKAILGTFPMFMALMQQAGRLLREKYPDVLDYARVDASRLDENQYQNASASQFQDNSYSGREPKTDEDKVNDPYEFNEKRGDDEPIFKERAQEEDPFEKAYRDNSEPNQNNKDAQSKDNQKGNDSSFSA